MRNLPEPLRQSALAVRIASLMLLFIGVAIVTAQASYPVGVDIQEDVRNWSLFSEYHKNQDYATAIPYGWNVVQLNPMRFKKLYERLAECYSKLAENADSTQRLLCADTMLIVYDLGIKNIPDKAPMFNVQKGYVFERYYEGRDTAAIAAYALGIDADFNNADFYYIDRLGVLYMKNIPNSGDYKAKAIELYRRYLERDPTSGVALDRLKKIVEDPHELIEIALQKLKTETENKEYIWNAAQAYIQAEEYAGALPHFEKLVKMEPQSETYLNELGKTYQRAERFKDAIVMYDRSLKVNPESKENLLNVALCYRELKNFSAARTYAQRAAAKDRSWGRPYLEIAQIYEATVADCVTGTKGGWTNMKLDDRLVYKLAQEYYARAKAIEPRIASEADARSRGLETLVPQQEDYFFNKEKIREGKIAIYGSCYEWIGESITVPPKFQ